MSCINSVGKTFFEPTAAEDSRPPILHIIRRDRTVREYRSQYGKKQDFGQSDYFPAYAGEAHGATEGTHGHTDGTSGTVVDTHERTDQTRDKSDDTRRCFEEMFDVAAESNGADDESFGVTGESIDTYSIIHKTIRILDQDTSDKETSDMHLAPHDES